MFNCCCCSPSQTPVLLSSQMECWGEISWSTITPCSCRTKFRACVYVWINMRFGLNQGRKLVHFSSPGWMWPLATLLLLQLCVTLWGESRAESLNLDIIISRWKPARLHFTMNFLSAAQDAWWWWWCVGGVGLQVERWRWKDEFWVVTMVENTCVSQLSCPRSEEDTPTWCFHVQLWDMKTSQFSRLKPHKWICEQSLKWQNQTTKFKTVHNLVSTPSRCMWSLWYNCVVRQQHVHLAHLGGGWERENSTLPPTLNVNADWAKALLRCSDALTFHLDCRGTSFFSPHSMEKAFQPRLFWCRDNRVSSSGQDAGYSAHVLVWPRAGVENKSFGEDSSWRHLTCHQLINELAIQIQFSSHVAGLSSLQRRQHQLCLARLCFSRRDLLMLFFTIRDARDLTLGPVFPSALHCYLYIYLFD